MTEKAGFIEPGLFRLNLIFESAYTSEGKE
ncbi:hypothetical protein SAMN06265368_0084 [Cohaesibacter gelatinilyticus]|uniref:Uncharacterized protein n=1 Tax=Cohaesibacter gelatinilyticus TaxID=372072 RepID=A0A285N8Q7_9HYPH|nr:hypothetical protein SAMN06265368_0084 [Cohaesibacter gelatinilyticus]